MRLKNDLKKRSERCLLLCNESFSTTTEEEGTQIAKDVVSAVSGPETLLYFVTHFIALAKAAPEFPAPVKAGNLVAEIQKDGGKALRTYRILPGTPSGEVFAQDLMESL